MTREADADEATERARADWPDYRNPYGGGTLRARIYDLIFNIRTALGGKHLRRDDDGS